MFQDPDPWLRRVLFLARSALRHLFGAYEQFAAEVQHGSVATELWRIKQRYLNQPVHLHDKKLLRLINKWAQGYQPAEVKLQGPSASSDAVSARPAARFVPKQRYQETRILEFLAMKGFNPKSLAKTPPGKRGVKHAMRDLARAEPQTFTDKTFDTAWQRLRADGRIRERQ